MDFEERMREATAALAGNRLGEAVALLSACCDDRPNEVEPALRLGQAHARMKHWDEAEHWLREARLLDPERAETHYLLGGVYECTRQLDLAETELARAVELQPDSRAAHRALERVQSQRVTVGQPHAPAGEADGGEELWDLEDEATTPTRVAEHPPGDLAELAGADDDEPVSTAPATPWERGGPLPVVTQSTAEEITARIERDRDVWLRLRHCSVASALELILLPFCLLNLPLGMVMFLFGGSVSGSLGRGLLVGLVQWIVVPIAVAIGVAIAVSVHNLAAQWCGGIRIMTNIDGSWYAFRRINGVTFAMHMTAVNVVVMFVNIVFSALVSGSLANSLRAAAPFAESAPVLGVLLLPLLYFAYSLLLAGIYNLVANFTGGVLFEVALIPAGVQVRRFELAATALTGALVSGLFWLPYLILWLGLALIRLGSLGLTLHIFAWLCLLTWLANAIWVGCYNLVANWNCGSGLLLTFDEH